MVIGLIKFKREFDFVKYKILFEKYKGYWFGYLDIWGRGGGSEEMSFWGVVKRYLGNGIVIYIESSYKGISYGYIFNFVRRVRNKKG